MNFQSLNDEQLWEAIAFSDNGRAFATVYDRYWKKVYGSAKYYLHDGRAAKQILHDVFVVLWERRKHLQIKNFSSYLVVATRYHVYSHLRAAKASPVSFVETTENLAREFVVNEAEARISSDDFEYQLSTLLKELPKRCREIFWMSRVENLTNDEIAEKLGISKRTVENQITHALKYLRLGYLNFTGASLAVFILIFLP